MMLIIHSRGAGKSEALQRAIDANNLEREKSISRSETQARAGESSELVYMARVRREAGLGSRYAD